MLTLPIKVFVLLLIAFAGLMVPAIPQAKAITAPSTGSGVTASGHEATIALQRAETSQRAQDVHPEHGSRPEDGTRPEHGSRHEKGSAECHSPEADGECCDPDDGCGQRDCAVWCSSQAAGVLPAGVRLSGPASFVSLRFRAPGALAVDALFAPEPRPPRL